MLAFLILWLRILLNSIISEVNDDLLLGAFLEVMKEEYSNSEALISKS